MTGIEKLKEWNRQNGITKIPLTSHPVLSDKSVTPEIKIQRLSECNACEFMELSKCMFCKCPIEIITSISPYSCPINKWGKI